MKSNEEFIAGIYEKAAVYTEEKETKIRKVPVVSRGMQIVAMFAVCLCLAGAGGLIFDNTGNEGSIPENQGENYGISLLSSEGEGDGIPMAQGRTMDGTIHPELTTVWGTVEKIDHEACILWLRLGYSEDAGMDQIPAEERVLIPVKWEFGRLPSEIEAGAKLQVGGEPVTEGVPGGTDWMMLVSERGRISMWMEEISDYRNFETGNEEK